MIVLDYRMMKYDHNTKMTFNAHDNVTNVGVFSSYIFLKKKKWEFL